MSRVWMSGEYLPEEEAKVSVFDRGFTLGDGLFETVFAHNGIPEFFHLHFRRMSLASDRLKIKLDKSEAELRAIIRRLCLANELEEASIRLTLTRGVGSGGINIGPESPGHLIITAQPFSLASRQQDGKGLKMCFSQYSSAQASGLDPAIKSTNYLVNIMAKHEAELNGFDDAIFLGANGCIAESTTASIFFVQGDTLYTPHLDSGILPGITRQVYIENILSHGFDFEERQIMPNELSEMGEVFLTSSLRGGRSVVSIHENEYEINGKWSQKLRKLYHEAAKKDYLRQSAQLN